MRLSLVWTVVRKDWFEFRKEIAGITALMFLPVWMWWMGDLRPDFADGFRVGGWITIPFMFAHWCLSRENQAESLGFLLSLPATRTELLVSKYASVYSMTLVSLNVSGIYFGLEMLFYANAAGLFFATFSVISAVISGEKGGSEIPIFAAVSLAASLAFGLDFSGWIDAHKTGLAILAYALIPFMVIASLWPSRKE